MATRTLEARFEHMAVHDENDDGSKHYSKSKVRLLLSLALDAHMKQPVEAVFFCWREQY